MPRNQDCSFRLSECQEVSHIKKYLMLCITQKILTRIPVSPCNLFTSVSLTLLTCVTTASNTSPLKGRNTIALYLMGYRTNPALGWIIPAPILSIVVTAMTKPYLKSSQWEHKEKWRGFSLLKNEIYYHRNHYLYHVYERRWNSFWFSICPSVCLLNMMCYIYIHCISWYIDHMYSSSHTSTQMAHLNTKYLYKHI